MSRIRGFVELLSRSEVRGWAFDEDEPARTVPIEVTLGGRRLALGVAGQPRPDLKDLGIGRINCGFSVPLPSNVALDVSALRVATPNGTESLPLAAAASALEGVFEKVDGRSVSGWAWRTGHPKERVQVIIRHRGKEVARAHADELREDLLQAGVGDGRHAFMAAVRVVEPPFEPEALSVEFEATGAPLVDIRPGARPAPAQAGAPPPIAQVKPQKLFVQKPAAQSEAPPATPPAPPPAPVREQRPAPPPAPRPSRPPSVKIAPVQRPAAEQGAPERSAPPPQAPAPPPAAPQAAPPPSPKYQLSPEALEAMRSALDFGDNDGLS